MKLKKKMLFMINIGLALGLILFFVLTEAFGKKYYLYQKRLELDRVEKSLRNEESNLETEAITGKFIFTEDNTEFNARLKKSLYGQNSWKYEFWFGKEAIEAVSEGRNVTRIFLQKNLKSSFLIRVFRDGEDIEAICLALPAIEENLKLMRTFSLCVFLLISILLWSLYTFYFKRIAERISFIESSLEKISQRDFSEVKVIDSKDEFQNISQKVSKVSEELNDYFQLIENKYESQRYFFNILAHELKTPITIIAGYAYHIREFLEEKEQKQCDIIINECSGISRMAKKFQNLAQNSKEMKIERFSFDTIISEIVERYILDFQDKNIELKITIIPINIEGDRELIKSVIDNLVSNAVSYASKKVEINLWEENNEVIFSIYNDGEKIPEKNLQKIWKPFYTLKSSEIRKYGSLGLGLAIASDILRRHKGSYEAINRKKGVEFIIKIGVNQKK